MIRDKREGGAGRSTRGRTIAPYAKGHLFEDVVEEYFRLLGYLTERNAKVIGLSGATHEIDVLVMKPGTKGVVEAKNYSRPIPKEWVMKAYNVARDIGAQEVYVVSASGFTEDAVKVAEVLGVKLLNLDDIAKESRRIREALDVPTYYLKPSASEDEVLSFASKFVVKRFFKPVERIDSVEMIYLPFYMFDVEMTYSESVGTLFKKTVERKKVVNIISGAFAGVLPILSTGGRYPELSFVQLKPMLDEDVAVYRLIGEAGRASISELEEKTGWSRQKLARVLSRLEKEGIVSFYEEAGERGRRRRVYEIAFAMPSFTKLVDTAEFVVEKENLVYGSPDIKAIADVRVQLSSMKRLLERLYSDVTFVSGKLIYIPFYRAKLASLENGSYRFIYILPARSPALVKALVEP